ncbi:WD40-repeat-containing domain protein [Radiomyces spectabilis]|uniref:WD40-repeat-containing domain protein n=1 Tax=Radiomyces spectabilis TaxID=64574 RepID=UPI0022208F1F|nr:WD40-repeat-containing domain protein [Radiomyces spectabilis]KAI8376295.1 WD40-repeat-containing domain protein [Radiomyces spectabilis]
MNEAVNHASNEDAKVGHDDEMSHPGNDDTITQVKGFLQRLGLGPLLKSEEQRKTEKEQHRKDVIDASSVRSVSSATSGSSGDSWSSESSNAEPVAFTSSSELGLKYPTNTPIHNVPYVKMKSHNKKNRAGLSRLVQVQTLSTETETGESDHGAIWSIEFSKDGKYMAAGGQSREVLVWQVRNADNHDDKDAPDVEDSMDVINEMPIARYKGHTADILDLSWSKNNFLLSSSMDKTVRLWHVSRKECLCVFRHLDFVPSIEFHPKDDRYFLSGSLDGKIRVWSIPEKKVVFWNELPKEDMVTAVGFTWDGKMVCAGTNIGNVFFYDTHELKYHTQIAVKESSVIGSRKGRKITGIRAMPGMLPDEEKILVTSNDSRVRLYNMKDKSLMFKFKGPVCQSMQIHANFSDDGQYIICGSEDGGVYLWTSEQVNFSPFHQLRDSRIKAAAALGNYGEQLVKTAMQSTTAEGQPTRLSVWLKRGSDRLTNHNEHFDAHDEAVTVATFAPTKTRQILARSGRDIIYKHTPVYVRVAQDVTTKVDEHNYVHQQDSLDNYVEADEETRRKYTYPDGHILVSADYRGTIKIWRMDSGIYETTVAPANDTVITAVPVAVSTHSLKSKDSDSKTRLSGLFSSFHH